MNYESDTPETDIECFIYEGDYVPASFARQLERERDEARKERNAALSDRDAWARLCGAVDCYSPSTAEPYEALKLQRDALRAELAKYTTDSGDDSLYNVRRLRAEIERAEAKTAAEYEAHGMTKCERDALKAEVERLKAACEKEFESVQQLNDDVERLETLYEAMKREKDDYQAQRDNIRLEADQLSTELHLERFSLKEMNAEIARLKAENGTLRNAQMCCESCDETVTVETLRELRADKARLDWIKALDCDSPVWGVLCDTTKLRETIDAAMKGEL